MNSTKVCKVFTGGRGCYANASAITDFNKTTALLSSTWEVCPLGTAGQLVVASVVRCAVAPLLLDLCEPCSCPTDHTEECFY